MSDLVLSLKVSRPYFWLVTVWLYVLPSGQQYDLLLRPLFWAGFAFCTFPLNLLCYLMNDISDADVDRHNPRKDGAIHGAKAGAERLRALTYLTTAVQTPFFALFSCAAL